MAKEVTKNANKNEEQKKVRTRGKALFHSLVFLTTLAIFFLGSLYVATDSDLGLKLAKDKFLTPALEKENLSLVADITGNIFRGYKIKNFALRGKQNLVTVAEANIDFSLRDLLAFRVTDFKARGVTVDIPAINKAFPSDPDSVMTSNEIVMDILFYINLPIAKIDIADTKIYFEDGVFAKNLLTLPRVASYIDELDSVHLDIKGRVLTSDLSLFGRADNIGTMNAKIDELTLKVSNNGKNIGNIALKGEFPSEAIIKTKASNLDLKAISAIFPGLKELDASGYLAGEFNFNIVDDDIKSFGKGLLTNGKIFGIIANNIALDWGFDDEVVRVTVNRGEVFHSSLKGNFVYDSRKDKERLTVKAAIENIKFDHLQPFIEDTANVKLGDLLGSISSLDANLDGPLNALKGHIKTAPSSISYKGLNFSKITLVTNFNGTPVGKINFNALLESKQLGVQGDISFKNGTNNVRYFAKGLPLKKILLAILGDNFGLDGDVAVIGSVKGTPEDLTVEAKINSSRIKTDYYSDLTDVTADISANISKEIYKIKSCSFCWQGAKFTASGTSDESGKLNFRGESYGLKLSAFQKEISDTTGMKADADIKLVWTVTGDRNSPIVNAKLTSAKGELNGVVISGINADITYSDNEIILKNVHLAMDDGVFSMDARVFLPQNNTPLAIDGNATANNFEIATIVKMFKLPYNLKGKVSGKLTATKISDGSNWKLNLNSPRVAYDKISFRDIKAEIQGTPKKISVKKIAADIFDSESTVTGDILFPNGPLDIASSQLNLKAECKDLNLYILSLKLIPALRGLKGFVSAESKIWGSIYNPQYEGDIVVERAAYIRHPLPQGKLHFAGNSGKTLIDPVTIMLREGTVKADAKFFLDATKNWQYYAHFTAADVPLDQFNIKLTDNPHHNVRGIVNIKAVFNGDINELKATAKMTSKNLTVYGIPVTDIDIPVTLHEVNLVSKNASAMLCGSKIRLDFNQDLKTDIYNAKLKTEEIDLAKLSKIVFADRPEEMSGKLELEVTSTGQEGRLSSNTTKGLLKLKNGEISGFEAIKASRKFTGEKSIRFEAVNVPFTYKSGDLTILPGTQAIAPDGDSLYKYVSLDGVITREGNINMSLQSQVNIKSLNSFLDASNMLLQHGVKKLTKDKDFDSGEILGGMLKSLIKGVAKREYRIIDMHIGGTIDEIKFSNLKLENNKVNDVIADIPHSSNDPDAEAMGLKGDRSISFKYSIPIGPTTSTRQENGGLLKDPFGTILDGLNFKF